MPKEKAHARDWRCCVLLVAGAPRLLPRLQVDAWVHEGEVLNVVGVVPSANFKWAGKCVAWEVHQAGEATVELGWDMNTLPSG